MAKMRGIKPEFWTDDKIVGLPAHARLLFIGMWNYACDNGHLDDSPLQLKMRVLPADNCDVGELLEALILAGVVERHDGYLKVPNLAQHQRIDSRYLTLCDHCEHDGRTTFTEDDRKPRTKRPEGDTTGAPRVHDVQPTGARAEGRKEGRKERKSPQPRPEVEALCTQLADRIEANGAKRPTITKGWTDAARLMIDRDDRDPSEASRLIDWCQRDEFWRANVLSMPKFRERYDQLRLQSERGGLRAVAGDHYVPKSVHEFEYHDE